MSSTTSASTYWAARNERERARKASRAALYAGVARASYTAPAPLYCKHCGASLFGSNVTRAAGRCTGPLTCPNAYTD